jgi:hypothetical protein
MSTKGKSTAAPKRKRAMSAKRKTAATVKRKREVPRYEAALEGRGRRFWTMRINPNDTAVIAETLKPCHLVIQNHGPGPIKLVAQNGDLMDLASGNLRATYVWGSVTVEVMGDKSALIELEFMPVFFKN